MQKMMYLLMSQHVSGIIMPIIRRKVQNLQRLWCTALALSILYHSPDDGHDDARNMLRR
jgi:hypothetical protein